MRTTSRKVREGIAELFLRFGAYIGHLVLSCDGSNWVRDEEPMKSVSDASKLLGAPDNDSWYRALAVTYVDEASPEQLARSFAPLAHRYTDGWPAQSSLAGKAWKPYVNLVLRRLYNVAFQNDPTRGFNPCSATLAEVAVRCGHTHAEDPIAVLAALGGRMAQWRDRYPEPADDASKDAFATYNKQIKWLGKIVNFLRAPSVGTRRSFPAALAKLTAPPPPPSDADAQQPDASANALVLAPPADAAAQQPAAPPDAAAAQLAAAAQQPDTAAAQQPATGPPLDDYLAASIRPRDDDCARCVVARDPGPAGVRNFHGWVCQR